MTVTPLDAGPLPKKKRGSQSTASRDELRRRWSGPATAAISGLYCFSCHRCHCSLER